MYEIHITVNTNEIEKFKDVCKSLGVKPIVLDLQDKTGNSVFHDVMTSNKYSKEDFLVEAKRIEDGLFKQGFESIRKKIECSPNCHRVPTKGNWEIKGWQEYFESHLRVLVNDETLEKLRDLLKNLPVHISKNVFKRVENDQYQMLLTIRRHAYVYEDFKDFVDKIVFLIKNEGYTMDKIEVEYVIYDSNKDHDNKWLEANGKV